MLQDGIQEKLCVQELALQPALHIGEAEDHGVRDAVGNLRFELLDGEHAVVARVAGSVRRGVHGAAHFSSPLRSAAVDSQCSSITLRATAGSPSRMPCTINRCS